MVSDESLRVDPGASLSQAGPRLHVSFLGSVGVSLFSRVYVFSVYILICHLTIFLNEM